MKFKLNENLTTIHYTLFPSWDGDGEVEYEFEPSILFDEEADYGDDNGSGMSYKDFI